MNLLLKLPNYISLQDREKSYINVIIKNIMGVLRY